MAAIRETVEISRSPDEVFAYLSQLDRHGEWQEQIIEVTVETEGPTRVGSRATDLRKVPGGKQRVSYEITEFDPPQKASFRGVNGPIRPAGTVTVEPLEGGSRSRVTLELDLVGHGLVGKLLGPLARRDARRQVPEDQRRLREHLEAGG